MKKEFLNFTGSSWGEFSNAGGKSRIPNALSNADQSLYDYIYEQMLDMDFSVEETLEYLSPYFGGGNYTTPTNSPDSWVNNTECDDTTFCVASDIDSWEYEHFQETELDGSLPSIGLFGKAIIKLYGCEGLVDVTNSTATPMDFYLVALTSAGHIAGSGFIAGNPQQNFLTQANGANLMLNFTSGNFNYLAPEVQDYLIDVQNFIINNCVAISTSPTNPYADTDYADEISQGSMGAPPMNVLVELLINSYGCYLFTESPSASLNHPLIYEGILEEVFIENPYLGYEFNFPEVPINVGLVQDIIFAGMGICNEEVLPNYEQSSPCESYLQAFEYLQANPQITIENAEGFGDAIFTLLGRNINTNEGTYGDAPVTPDSGQGYSVSTYDNIIYEQSQTNCNSFMNYTCWGEGPAAYSIGSPPPELTVYYNPEEVANTLASALLSLNQLVLDIANGVISLEEIGAPAGSSPFDIFEVVEELLERVVELEQECNNLGLVPVVVEQALGQMLEDYITFAYNSGLFDSQEGNPLGDMSLEDVVCMDEYYHNDSFFYIFELLNYTPSICGGGCPDCPDCPDCPPVVGGGVVGQVGLCSDGRPPKFDGKKYICSDGRPPKGQAVKPVKNTPKYRLRRNKI